LTKNNEKQIKTYY